MSNNPSEAYKAAKAKQAQRLQHETQREDKVRELPALAELELQEIKQLLSDNTPDGLKLEFESNVGGGLNNGIKGLYLTLYEDNKKVAEGSIQVASDYVVELTDHTSPPKSVKFKSTTFERLNDDLGLDFLSYLITSHIT